MQSIGVAKNGGLKAAYAIRATSPLHNFQSLQLKSDPLRQLCCNGVHADTGTHTRDRLAF